MAYPYKPPAGNKILSCYMADVGAVSSAYVATGFDGRIKRIVASVYGAITGADSVVTTKIGTTTVTGGTVTVTLAGAAAGNVSTAIPSGANVFRATDFISFTSDGGASNTQPVMFTLEVEPV